MGFLAALAAVEEVLLNVVQNVEPNAALKSDLYESLEGAQE